MVMEVGPGVRTCTISGVVTDANTTPAAGVVLTSSGFPTLGARTTMDGFYHLIVREGTHVVTATRAREQSATSATCDPTLEPTLDGIDVTLGDRLDPNVPRIAILDPATDEQLEAIERVIAGTVNTALVRSVRIETHVAGLPDAFVAEVPVSGHAFAGVARLVPGRRNTVIVTGSDGRLLGSAHRVLDVAQSDGEPEPTAASRSGSLDGRDR
jgi:hypothetical protein